MSHFFFSIVISAELVVDIFFWLTAFLSCYYLLNHMKMNEGSMGNIFIFYANRIVRLLPTYMFVLFFFWKFLVLFGGDGPIFFQYITTTECSKYWFWHMIFINNLIPWDSYDSCMRWTWYLANDFQFFLLVPIFTTLYYNNRKWFYITLGGVIALSKVI